MTVTRERLPTRHPHEAVRFRHGVALETIRGSLRIGAVYQALAFFDRGPIRVVPS